MTTDIKDKAAVEQKLWDEIGDTRFGMVGLTNTRDHFQPMTTFVERETGKLWFYSQDTTDLAAAASNGAEAMYVFMSKDRQLQACIRGTLTATHDTLHRDKYWNSVVAAWFPKGKDDPHLTMLCLDCEDSQVWISEVGTVKFGVEIAKANLTGTLPHLGDQTRLSLAS